MLDTGAYVAALLSATGGAAAVFERIIEQAIFNFYTEEILVEVRNVLQRPKFNLDAEKRDHFLHILQEASFEVQRLQAFQIKKCRDPKDDKFLSLASQIDADFLITLDEDLLVIEQLGKTRILTPGEFLAVFRES